MIHDHVSKEQTARAVLIRQKRDRIAHLNAKFSIQADKRDTEDCDKCSQAILFQWPGFCDGPCSKRRKRGDEENGPWICSGMPSRFEIMLVGGMYVIVVAGK